MSAPARHLRTDPLVADDATIAAALEEVSVPALVASVVHLTGDASFVRGTVRPRQFVMNEFQGKLEEPEKAALRAASLQAIAAWRDVGCPEPPTPDPAVVREVMDWIACEPVAQEYAALYAEEMDLAAENPRAIRPTAPVPDGFSVVVIGCGEGGVLAALRLKEAGIPFTVLEKGDDVGGTWLVNTYPGCRVDVASHYYSYSFESNAGFSEYYTRQPELRRYFRDVFDAHGLAPHVRWRTEVERAVWDEADACWRLTVRGPDGGREEVVASAVVSAVGLLSRPLVPDLPGLQDFPGPVFHSAEWDHGVDLTGKRVALIGAGASGFQIAPTIADTVENLVVFQRTPQWMAPNPRYQQPVRDGERWAMRHLPGYARWFRFMLMWQSSDALLELVRADPEWHDFPRTANAFSAARRELFAAWIEKHTADDPDLAAKVMPDYPPMAKRMLQDDGSWLRCLGRPDVELVDDAIVGIGPAGITTGSGTHEADVIVLATGFRASEVLLPMEVVGRDGRVLHALWDGRPAAYRGVSVAGFPNFFMLSGPGTGLAHAGSVIFTTECQMRYAGEALAAVLAGGHRAVEPTEQAYEDYAAALQAEVATLMWGHPSIEHSWYKAADGGVYILNPWRSVDYWEMTRRVDPADHLFT